MLTCSQAMGRGDWAESLIDTAKQILVAATMEFIELYKISCMFSEFLVPQQDFFSSSGVAHALHCFNQASRNMRCSTYRVTIEAEIAVVRPTRYQVCFDLLFKLPLCHVTAAFRSIQSHPHITRPTLRSMSDIKRTL